MGSNDSSERALVARRGGGTADVHWDFYILARTLDLSSAEQRFASKQRLRRQEQVDAVDFASLNGCVPPV